MRVIAFPLDRARLPTEAELWARVIDCRSRAFDPDTGDIVDERARRALIAVFEVWMFSYRRSGAAAA